MAIKKALIVDDSRSARVVLKRMLEELLLEVDAVESADDAIAYLKKYRPDVIFMDHNMPGMDGFEAVKLIKKDSRTAVIPIMMYTSRGGDVYLSQARALGAVGIIPKTISPVGLKESLFKLGLVDDRRLDDDRRMENDRRTDDRRSPRPEAEKSAIIKPDEQFPETSLYSKNSEYRTYLSDLQRLMDDQTIELHKSMWLGVESVSNEIFHRLNGGLDEHFESLQSALSHQNKTPWPVYTVAALLVVSVIFNIVLLSDINQLENKAIDTIALATNELAELPEKDTATKGVTKTFSNSNSKTEAAFITDILSAANEASTAEIDENTVANQETSQDFIKWAQNKTIEYPYDELALNDKRLPGIEELLDRALKSKYTGSIILQTHVGRFCLSRDQFGDYVLAEDDLPVTQCEYIGNHVQPTDIASTHQSLSFANYLSDLSLLNENGIVIEVTNVARAAETSKYPSHTSQTRAKEWNQAAQNNNRVTIKLIPSADIVLSETP